MPRPAKIEHIAATGALTDLGPFTVPAGKLDKKPNNRVEAHGSRMLTTDGLYGNAHSWIAATTASGEWAQVELAQPAKVDRVVFSRDRDRRYSDRVPVRFEVRLSLDGEAWVTVARVSARVEGSPVRPSGKNLARLVPAPPPVPGAKPPSLSPLQYAFLGEEHAWLK